MSEFPLYKLKYLAPQVIVKAPYSEVDRPYVGLEHIRSWTGEININENASPEGLVSVFEPGDILFGKLRPYLAKVARPDFGGVCSTEALVLRSKSGVDSRYLRYALVNEAFLKEIDSSTFGAKMPRASWEFIGSRLVPLPNLGTQSTIADFLDLETARIDELIEKKQEMIRLLGDKRDSEIIQVLTLGVMPAATLRKSGIEWLESIPEHWSTKRVKHLFRLVCHPAPVDNDMELLSLYTDIGVRPRRELEPKGNKASTTDGYWIVRKGDIVVNKLLAWMGAVGYSDYDGVTSPAYDILRPKPDVYPKFYHYLFRSSLVQNEFRRWSRGIMDMRLRLYFDELGRITVPVPPFDEQCQIVEHIETCIDGRLENLLTKIRTNVKTLYEFRTALISATVTGQIDVDTWRKRGNTERRLDALEEEMSV